MELDKVKLALQCRYDFSLNKIFNCLNKLNKEYLDYIDF
jgi:hypothetical protein